MIMLETHVTVGKDLCELILKLTISNLRKLTYFDVLIGNTLSFVLGSSLF